MTLFRKNKGKGEVQQEFQTTVRFLDDSEPILLPFTKDTLGQFVLDKVCDTLNLVEKDYFGLRYVDTEKQRHWLDPAKTVYKQLKDIQGLVQGTAQGVSPCVLCFRVKFYPTDPMKMHEEITRYYMFLQLRRDLHHGRLLCSPADANLLAAYIIQSELGDYDPQDHPPGYVAEFKMLPSQNVQQEQEIHELHKTLAGEVPAEAEANFLQKASTLDTFGVDPHKVRDQKGTQMYLGVTHQGIMTFHGSRRTQIYKWSQIKKLAFEGKTFIVHVNINEESETSNMKKKHQPIGYKCLTVPACKYLWRCAVEQQFFFTLQNSFHSPKVRSGGSLFSRGSKFRFSGRCQNEAFIASEDIKRQEPQFQRTCSLPTFQRKTDSRSPRNATSVTNDSITEDKGGSRYKADTLPRMVTVPTVSVEAPQFSQSRPVSGGGSRDSLDKKTRPDGNENKENEKRKSTSSLSEKRKSTGSLGKKSRPDSSENKENDKRKSTGGSERPKLVEIAKQSSQEKVSYCYTEVIEQKQSVLENEHTIVAETRTEVKSVMKPVEVEVVESVVKPVEAEVKSVVKPVEIEVKSVTKPVEIEVVAPLPEVNHKESAVDVPQSNAQTQQNSNWKPLTEDMIVTEEITPVKVEKIESATYPRSKQNGDIPIIVTSAYDSVKDESSLLYDPNDTAYDEEEDGRVAKSLEDQVLELEKQYESMKEANHTGGNVVDEKMEVAQTAKKAESSPGSKAAPVEKKKGGCSCGKVLAFTFFSVIVTLTVTACVVMFSDIEHPIMDQLRTQLTFLEPGRDYIIDRYNNLFPK